MITFTKSQRDAIEHPGNLVITACPGSGKTTVISEKIRNEVDGLKRHRGVIAITFTRKASKELATRCKRGGKETKSSFFGTIDAFCISEIVLPFSKFIFGHGPENLEPKFSDELTDEERLIIEESKELLGEIDSNNINDYLPILKNLYQRGCIFFPAIPFLANHIIKNSKACRNYLKARYSTVYIDEYQDSSSAQHNLFLLLLELGIRGICVGDVQQSIYGWRKSSPEFLKQLIGRPDFHHVTVSINYRCHTSISNYANRLFSENVEITATEEIRVYQCLVEGDELDTASKLNKIIPSILKKFPVGNSSDIAILTRYNKGLQRLKDKLTIPCKIYTEDELGKIESKTSQLWSSLIEFRFNKTILVDDILNTYSSFADTHRNRLKSLRDAIKKTRTVSLEDLEDCLAGTSKILLGTTATALEINALHQIIQDPEALNHYLPPTNDQVQCMTLHKSKGLEFDIVIHLDLVDWVFPKRIPGENFNDTVYPELEQDLNLHYVGITRAKRACILIHTTQRINAQGVIKQANPSMFLNLPGLEDLYKVVKQ
ncbi:DNA helicase-2/ATP-dependent DNA helicase PcrA [Pseudomonas lini]|uniref:UvrD-helicase domain-containing protein n=1 Tax=Pseudomonas lini TaxID=163011 RepID=UPI0027872C35|nr:ATP-dependent helicase [Pseudomonas lini]MDQ0122473.1 DNA helicase-2/ATP-dependent DNA helicase PcrA [Pseudomonas lini]